MNLLADLLHEMRRHKRLCDEAIAPLGDDAFFRRPADHSNPIAVIVKHLAGNLVSRWTDFLTTDGNKPTRDRDGEFVIGADDTRPALMAAWERGWAALFGTVESLSDEQLGATVTIRGEPHTVQQALVRGTMHLAYHAGQILYLARLHDPEGKWLTIAPGASQGFRKPYRQES